MLANVYMHAGIKHKSGVSGSNETNPPTPNSQKFLLAKEAAHHSHGLIGMHGIGGVGKMETTYQSKGIFGVLQICADISKYQQFFVVV